jgi:two-component system chemotaxis response regulator CheY
VDRSVTLLPQILAILSNERLIIPRKDATVPGKILVVDDSDDTREMMAKLLELESFTVVTAEDGSAGLDTADAERPDLIITDVNMPVMNGIEMIRRLREQDGFATVPIMAITAYGNGVAKEALDAGANRAATKPIRFNALVVAIKELLGKTA